MHSNILAPAAVLVLWSLVVLIWVAVTRLRALPKAGIDLKVAAPGGRGVNLDGVLPDNVQWKSHNFTHLMEQPTLFYATVLILAVMGASTQLNMTLAWVYVGLRIVHSIWQATVNTIPVRFTLFIIGTICLFVLAINALRATLAA